MRERPCKHGATLVACCNLCRVAVCNKKYAHWLEGATPNPAIDCSEKGKAARVELPVCQWLGDIAEYAACGCVRKAIHYCNEPSETIDRCTRGASADPEIVSCASCTRRPVTS